jgi:lipoate-protein ligase A
VIYCLNRHETNPYFNIAAEEFLLKEFQHDVFSVWRNEKSIIIGKHQNASREINHDFVKKHKIPVIRRITGGGTVYHDPGNINFSFITTGEMSKLVDFRKYTKPIIDFLKTLGIHSEFSGKNNLVVNGLKISGNSAHVYKNRVLHHGTLLVSSDLATLNKAISGREQLYTDKSVRSIRSRVNNINDILENSIDALSLQNELFSFVTKSYQNSILYDFNELDKRRINELMNDRYLKDDWNYGYSPEYTFRNNFIHDDKNVFIKLEISRGIIRECSITYEGEDKNKMQLINNALKGVPHQKDVLEDIVSYGTFAEDFSGDFLNQLKNYML